MFVSAFSRVSCKPTTSGLKSDSKIFSSSLLDHAQHVPLDKKDISRSVLISSIIVLLRVGQRIMAVLNINVGVLWRTV